MLIVIAQVQAYSALAKRPTTKIARKFAKRHRHQELGRQTIHLIHLIRLIQLYWLGRYYIHCTHINAITYCIYILLLYSFLFTFHFSIIPVERLIHRFHGQRACFVFFAFGPRFIAIILPHDVFSHIKLADGRALFLIQQIDVLSPTAYGKES